MLFAVVQTHHRGTRLSREEIRAAEPIIGQLVISDWLEGNAAGRAIRVANLKHPTTSYCPNLLSPIFDPQIVKMTTQGFLLLGTQIRCDEQLKPVETLQGWWVRFST
ncbi:hypothetical protein [Dechloromonas sp. A34]|uniref:hypothetical protein n=1 Tax=Dechloromonas sp. A34 TaxID=447588 RepID=UPI0022495CAC|nr:hypothetical protein [Dechloromonas sp. A34]